MKMKRFVKTALLVTASLAIVASSARAQVIYNNANGDFLLGFRQTGSTNSVLLDIGPIANFNVMQTFSLGNVATLLSSTFGAGWATDANVWFSLAATTRPGDAANTNYMTRASAVPWNRLTNTNSAILQNKVIAQGNQYNAFSGQQTLGNPGVIEAQALAPDGYREYHPGGTNDAGHANGNISYGFFNPETEANFGGGIPGLQLALIQLVPGTGPGTNLGFFSLSADGGTLTFSPIPEPSTYALAVLGLAGLLLVQRLRRKAVSV
jgi:hypothetical protein